MQLSTTKAYSKYQFAWGSGERLERLVVNGMGFALGDLPKVRHVLLAPASFGVCTS